MTVSNSRSQPNIVLTTLVPVVAEKNDIGDIYREHIRKFLPLLRLPEFNLVRAANYLEDWIGDMLPAKPLLDVWFVYGKAVFFADSISDLVHFFLSSWLYFRSCSGLPCAAVARRRRDGLTLLEVPRL